MCAVLFSGLLLLLLLLLSCCLGVVAVLCDLHVGFPTKQWVLCIVWATAKMHVPQKYKMRNNVGIFADFHLACGSALCSMRNDMRNGRLPPPAPMF